MGPLLESYKKLSKPLQLIADNRREVRPMRSLPVPGEDKRNFPSKIVNSVEDAVFEAHQAFFRQLFELLPGPSWQALTRQENAQKWVFVQEHACGPECNHGSHYQDSEKKYSPSQISDIDARFQEAMGLGTDIAMQQYANDWFDTTYGEIGSPTRWQGGLLEMIRKTITWAFNRNSASWARLVAKYAWARALNRDITQLIVDPSLPWIIELYDAGFNLVKDKIFRFFLPEIKQTILRGLRDGLSWDQLSRSLYRKYGARGLYQWQRLIRSEMARAIDEATREQYKQSGVKAVKWSAALGRCPICDDIATTNGGYYAIDKAPRVVTDTHPNCLCLILEVWRLPVGITV